MTIGVQLGPRSFWRIHQGLLDQLGNICGLLPILSHGLLDSACEIGCLHLICSLTSAIVGIPSSLSDPGLFFGIGLLFTPFVQTFFAHRAVTLCQFFDNLRGHTLKLIEMPDLVERLLSDLLVHRRVAFLAVHPIALWRANRIIRWRRAFYQTAHVPLKHRAATPF